MRVHGSLNNLLASFNYNENMQAKFHVGARRPDALGFRSCRSARQNMSRCAFIEHKAPGMPVPSPKAATSEGPRSQTCPSATPGLVTLKFQDLIAGKDLSAEIEKVCNIAIALCCAMLVSQLCPFPLGGRVWGLWALVG